MNCLKKYVDKPDKLSNALKELYKIEVFDKNLHGIKEEILGDYSGEVELIDKLLIGDHVRANQIRFRNINDFEVYINSFDQDYDSEDCIFNGYFFKLNTLGSIIWFIDRK